MRVVFLAKHWQRYRLRRVECVEQLLALQVDSLAKVLCSVNQTHLVLVVLCAEVVLAGLHAVQLRKLGLLLLNLQLRPALLLFSKLHSAKVERQQKRATRVHHPK